MQIVDDFEVLDSWDDRYRYVIELGRGLPQFPEAARTDRNKVQGCASQVWLHPRIDGEGPGATFDFAGESDAMIPPQDATPMPPRNRFQTGNTWPSTGTGEAMISRVLKIVDAAFPGAPIFVSIEDFSIIEGEPIVRRLIERRIRQARFPTVKSLDSFDFAAIPSLNKLLVLELARVHGQPEPDYGQGVVTPHAAFLAMMHAPAESYDNLAAIEAAFFRAHIAEFKAVVKTPEFKQLYALATPAEPSPLLPDTPLEGMGELLVRRMLREGIVLPR